MKVWKEYVNMFLIGDSAYNVRLVQVEMAGTNESRLKWIEVSRLVCSQLHL